MGREPARPHGTTRGISWAERLTDLYILLMLTAFPLYTGFQGYGALTEAKLQCFLVLTLGYFGLTILLSAELLLVGKLARPTKASVRKTITPTRVLMVLFVLVCALSSALSSNPADTWLGTGRYEGMMTTFLYAGVFLMLSLFARPKIWHAYVAAGTLTVICIIAMIQYMGANPFALYPQGTTYHDAFQLYSGAFLSTIGNVDLLSGLLCLAVPLFLTGFLAPAALGILVLLISGVSAGLVGLGLGALLLAPLVLNSPKRLANGAIALSVVTLAAGLALFLRKHEKSGGAGITAALIAAIIIFAALGLLFQKKSPSLTWTRRRCSFAVGTLSLAVLLGGLALIYFWPGVQSGMFYEASRILHGEAFGHFGSGRIGIWRNCLALVPEHPLLGSGPGTLAQRVQMSFQREVQPGLVLNAVVDAAHNEYLDILVNVGFLGMGTYLAAIVSTLVSWRKRAVESSAAMMLAAALMCYLVQAFFSFSICITAPFFWIVWGMLDAAIVQQNRKRSE